MLGAATTPDDYVGWAPKWSFIVSSIALITLQGTTASESLNATVKYDANTDTYNVVREIDGNGGNDTLTAFSMPIVVNGETLDFGSVLVGGTGNDTLNGGNRDDVLHGGGGSNILNGGAGNDTLSGEGVGNVFKGSTGDDRMLSTGGDVSVDGGSGSDTLVAQGDL